MKWQPISEFDFNTDKGGNVLFSLWYSPPRVGYLSVSGWRYEDHDDGHLTFPLIKDLSYAVSIGITHFIILDPIPGEIQI